MPSQQIHDGNRSTTRPPSNGYSYGLQRRPFARNAHLSPHQNSNRPEQTSNGKVNLDDRQKSDPGIPSDSSGPRMPLNFQELGSPSRGSETVAVTPRRGLHHISQILPRRVVSRIDQLSPRHNKRIFEQTSTRGRNPDSSGGEVPDHQLKYSGQGITLKNIGLGSPTPESQIAAATPRRGIHHISQIFSGGSGRSFQDKFNRLVAAISDGRCVRFTPKSKSGNYDAFAIDSELFESPGTNLSRQTAARPQRSGRIVKSGLPYPESPGVTLERRIAACPQNFGRIVNQRLPQLMTEILRLGTGSHPRFTVSFAEADDSSEGDEDVEEEGHYNEKENEDDLNTGPPGCVWEDEFAAANEACSLSDEDVTEAVKNKKDKYTVDDLDVGASMRSWENTIAAANEAYNLRHENSNPEDTVVRGVFRPVGLSQEPQSDPSPAAQDQAGTQRRTVAPIPFSLHKAQGMRTPSIHSNSTELDCSSPLFHKSFEEALKQVNRRLVLGVKDPLTGNEKEPFDNEIVRIDLVLKDRILDWLSQVTPESRLGLDRNTFSKGNVKTVNIHEDFQLAGLTERKSDTGTDLQNVLGDVATLHNPGYLQHNSFHIENKVATSAYQNAFAMEGASTGQGELQIHPSVEPYLAEYWREITALPEKSIMASRSSAPARLEGLGEDNLASSPSSLSSGAFEDSREDLPNSSSRAAGQALALARLEGGVAPEPQVEDEGPRLRRPTPLACFNMMRVIAQLEANVKEWLKLGTPIPDVDSVTDDGGLSERPANPTPQRALALRRPGGVWLVPEEVRASSP